MLLLTNAAKARGFTLMELLVSSTVLILLVVTIAGITDSTSRVTSLSDRRMTADSGARQVLDRIGSDFDRSLQREDLPDLIEQQSGNDRITFFAQSEGYKGDRGISEISYTVPSGEHVLRRGVLGTSWSTSGTSINLAFSTTTIPVIPAENYEIVASDVFRFEIAFLMANGSIVAKADRLVSPANTPDAQKVRALIVGIVALDRKARASLPNGDVAQLSALFLDAENNKDLLDRWSNALEGSSLPTPVLNSVHMYQRYFYLK